MSTKPCPTCGTLNDATAGFCSNCSTVLATTLTGTPEAPTTASTTQETPPPADDAAGYASGRPEGQAPAAPPPPQAPPPPPGTPFATPVPPGAQQWAPPPGTSSSKRKFVPIGIGIAVIVVIRLLLAGALFGGGGPDTVTLPTSVGGLPQIVTGQPAINAQQFKASLAQANVTGGDAAAYGTGPDASYYALVAPGNIDSQENFDKAKASLETPSSQLTVGAQTEQTAGGISMICADLSGSSGPTGEMCVFSQDFQGIVISTEPDATQTAQFAAQVHDSIQ